MTLSDDLNFAQQAGGSEEASSPYPVAFGITFTPPIIGGIIAALGLLGAIYMVLTIVMPAWDNFQQQLSKVTELETQITQKKLQAQQIDKAQKELEQIQQQQKEVLGLFANEKSIETLLLDTNRLIESSNVQVPANAVRAKLKKFIPVTEKPEIITDSSYGLLVNNKLKRLRFNAEIVGTFTQTQAIMRNIERLQPLLIVKNYQSSPGTYDTNSKKTPIGPVPISTDFQLEALMPLTPEEAAIATKVPKK